MLLACLAFLLADGQSGQGLRAATLQAVNPKASAYSAEFARYDITGSGTLSGTELNACRCRSYDVNGDGKVSLAEFQAGRILAEYGIASAGSDTEDVQPSDDVQPTDAQPVAAQPMVARGPFSWDELIAYLRSIPHYQDSSVPSETRNEAHEKLVRLVKTRGVDFRINNALQQTLVQEGASSWGWLAVRDNYRAPGTSVIIADASYFLGRWRTGTAGQTTRYDRQGSGIVRTDRGAGARGGVLEFNANGTYVWQVLATDPLTRQLRGRWRPATEREMGDEPGEGLVLLRAHEQKDWIVTLWNPPEAEVGLKAAQLMDRYRFIIGNRER
jgi:hypothetical protein